MPRLEQQVRRCRVGDRLAAEFTRTRRGEDSKVMR